MLARLFSSNGLREMTVIPLNLREPIRKAKRWFGLIAATVGALVLLATLAWLVAYFAARGIDLVALRASFGREFGYWSPVLFFCLPGLLLLIYGRRMMRDAALSLLEFVFVLAILTATIVVVYFGFSPSALDDAFLGEHQLNHPESFKTAVTTELIQKVP